MNKYLREYEHIKNGSNKLIIVCSGFPNTKAVSEIIDTHGVGTNEYLNEMQKHWNLLNYYQMKSNGEFDFLYIKDKFNDYFGYMYIEDENYILDNYANELDTFINMHGYNKRNVTICGSSKGGFVARLLGYKCDNITNIIAGIPHLTLQIYNDPENPSSAIRQLHSVLWSTEKKANISNKVVEYELNVCNPDKKEIIITSLHDIFINDFALLNNYHANIYIFEENVTHSETITLNLKLFLNIIYSVARNETPEFGVFKKYELNEIKKILKNQI